VFVINNINLFFFFEKINYPFTLQGFFGTLYKEDMS